MCSAPVQKPRSCDAAGGRELGCTVAAETQHTSTAWVTSSLAKTSFPGPESSCPQVWAPSGGARERPSCSPRFWGLRGSRAVAPWSHGLSSVPYSPLLPS